MAALPVVSQMSKNKNHTAQGTQGMHGVIMLEKKSEEQKKDSRDK